MPIELKQRFEEYIKKIIPENEFSEFLKYCEKPTRKIIRCNTLKISPDELKSRLEKKGWEISQPYTDYPEIMIIESQLQPGELGKSIEHQTGLYYVQELSSMMSPIALSPDNKDYVLDLCAAPGSKTTQMSAMMENSGLLIANDVKIDRLRALVSNLERQGCTNVITTRMDGVQFCIRLEEKKLSFSKILLDAPCSGQGVIRSDSKVWNMFNENMNKGLSLMQKKLLASCISILKPKGVLVYSTCTFSPEENEEVIQFALDNFPVELEEIKLPLKTRQGLSAWKNKSFSEQIKLCHRIYPHDNDTEGFFVARLRLK
jgi:NOL1/NOP2/sun family putative RNA methylase